MYPALSLAARLVERGDEVAYVGTPDGPEARLVPGAGIAFTGLATTGFDRARPLSALSAGVRALAATARACALIRRTAPAIVVGFGGYVTLPVGLAAALCGVPLMVHEQNAVVGLANRVLARVATAVAVTYPETAASFAAPCPVVVTGNPVRRAVTEVTREQGRRALGVPDDATLLLAFGGSRGARHLNEALVRAAPAILAEPHVHVVHVAGASEAASVRSLIERIAAGAGRWHVHGYLDEMPAALAAADLVVARAGATTVAEITARGIAAVLVPYPYATDDHQTANARALAEAGGAVLVPDRALDSAAFEHAVVSLLRDPGARATMAAASRALGRPSADEALAELVHATARPGTDHNDRT